MKNILLCAIALLSIAWSPSYNAFKAYQKKDFSGAQKILEQKQIDTPLDPLINYNLGTAYYKQKKHEAAKQSFLRASQHSFGKNKNLHNKATFNLGNALYKNTLDMLPENWEKEKLDDEMRKQAIAEVTQSIESYKNIQDKDDERIKTNQKAAEELLKKLQQNKQQQKQDKKDQKKDKKQDKQNQDKQQKPQDKDQKKQNQDKQPDKKKQQPQQKPQQKKKTMEQRKREVLLSKLDEQEKKAQKARLKQKSKKQAKPQNKFQKRW
jgi:hypothetical protein